MQVEPYYSHNDFVLWNGDSASICQQLPPNLVDCVFADPPYFLSSGNGKVRINNRIISFDKGDWDRARSSKEVHEFNTKWISACRQVLKPNGTIWVSGTYHNIFDVAICLQEQRFKILNIIVWQKSDPPTTITDQRFNFSAEYIIWARKEMKVEHFFNYELMKSMNGGVHMPDVWKIPAPSMWEKKCGKHPTQKPLRLLYRIILACTHEGDTILDPFTGSCTTGIAAQLLGRKFIGVDMSEEFLQLGIRRVEEISNTKVAEKFLCKMRENPEEVTVIVNHARKDTRELMIEKGICYMRAGESDGSLQVTPGFEKMRYVLLHTGGDDAQLFHIKKGKEGSFSIWKKETLEQHGFHPEHAEYYIVIPFDNKPVEFTKPPRLKQRINTYRSKVRPLSDFTGLA